MIRVILTVGGDFLHLKGQLCLTFHSHQIFLLLLLKKENNVILNLHGITIKWSLFIVESIFSIISNNKFIFVILSIKLRSRDFKIDHAICHLKL